MTTISTLDKIMNKIETVIFSSLFSFTIITSLVGIINDNIEMLESKEKFELSKNRRDIEVVDNYYLPEIKMNGMYAK